MKLLILLFVFSLTNVFSTEFDSKILFSNISAHFGPHFMSTPDEVGKGSDPATPSVIVNTGIRAFGELGFDNLKLRPGIGFTYYRSGYGFADGDFGATIGFRKLIETFEFEFIGDVVYQIDGHEPYVGVMYNLPLFGTVSYYDFNESYVRDEEKIGFLGSTDEGAEYNNMFYVRLGYKYFIFSKYGIGFEINKGLTNFVSRNGKDLAPSEKTAVNITFTYMFE